MSRLSKIQASVISAFAADSHALGGHWIYDAQKLKEHGTITTLEKPLAQWHAGKEAGDFTHVGDQAFVLLQHINKNKKLDIDSFAQEWVDFMNGHNLYKDTATKNTLESIKKFGIKPAETGFNSAELAPIARIAPLFLAYNSNLEDAIQAVKTHNKFTHNNGAGLEMAEYITRLYFKALDGTNPKSVLKETLEELPKNEDSKAVAELVHKGLSLDVNTDTTAAVATFGPACGYSGALPGAIFLINKYIDNPEQGLIDNVMAGGDSAARGTVFALLAAAYHGEKAIPSWAKKMNKYQQIETLSKV